MTSDEMKIIESIEDRITRHECEDRDWRAKVSRQFEEIVEKNYGKDLEYAKMKTELTTISDYIGSLTPEKRAKKRMLLTALAVIFAGLQVTTSVIILIVSRSIQN